MAKFVQILGGVAMVLVGLLTYSCGPPPEGETTPSTNETGNGGLPPRPVGQPIITKDPTPERKVPVTMAVASGIGAGLTFNLTTSASSWTVDVDGCASGYTATGLTDSSTAADSGIELYLYDQDCLVKLVEFTYDFDGDATPETYNATNAGGVNFNDWRDHATSGAEAIFSDGVNLLWVRVKSQVPSEISGPTTVEYVFSELNSGTGSTGLLEPTTSSGTTINDGAAGPNLRVNYAELKSLDVNNAGTFWFIFECAGAGGMTDITTPDDTYSTCDAESLKDMDYILVDDTFSGGGVTAAELDTAFSGGSPTALAAANVYLNADNNAYAPAGGFYTEDLQGPDDAELHKDMILAVRYTDPVLGTLIGYIWFEVDLVLVKAQ